MIKLKDYLGDETNVPSLESAAASSRDIASSLSQNKDLIKSTITYLNQNRENINDVTLSKLNS